MEIVNKLLMNEETLFDNAVICEDCVKYMKNEVNEFEYKSFLQYLKVCLQMRNQMSKQAAKTMWIEFLGSKYHFIRDHVLGKMFK